MSFELVKQSYAVLDIKSGPSSVLRYLADKANERSCCWPALDTICEATKMSKTAVKDALSVLKEAGHIKIFYRTGRQSRYYVTPKYCEMLYLKQNNRAEYEATLELSEEEFLDFCRSENIDPEKLKIANPAGIRPGGSRNPTGGQSESDPKSSLIINNNNKGGEFSNSPKTAPLTSSEEKTKTPPLPEEGFEVDSDSDLPEMDGLKKKTTGGGECTLSQWKIRRDEQGLDHYNYSPSTAQLVDDLQLPDEYVHLAWFNLVQQYEGKKKKYSDWGGRLLNQAIKGNWGRIWFRKDSGEYVLTTAGKQIEMLLNARLNQIRKEAQLEL